MKTVLIFGTFDFLHAGHLHFFEEAKALGDRLVAAVARDSVVHQLKGKGPIHDEQERMKLVSSLRIIDDVTLGDHVLSTYRVIERLKPDVIALGYDQVDLYNDLQQKVNGIDLITIGAYKPHDRKSSAIKELLPI